MVHGSMVNQLSLTAMRGGMKVAITFMITNGMTLIAADHRVQFVKWIFSVDTDWANNMQIV